MQAVHPNLPLGLAQNENVVNFSTVEGVAFVFANMPATADVRAELDEIFADVDMEFSTARHSSAVDVEIENDFDMLFLYE